jgi:hypothetical protein
MFDTLTLRLATSRAEAITPRLAQARGIVDAETREVSWSGKLRNLIVRVRPGSVWLTGSLAKFHLGNNVETMSRTETTRAIERLSDVLGESVAQARVFRLDIGQTFEVSQTPAVYWREFVTPARMRRQDYGVESLTFCNKQRAVIFYDKQAESRRRGGKPSEMAGAKESTAHLSRSNLLRFEVQFKRRISRVFAWPDIKAATLSDPAFCETAVMEWKAVYFRLERSRLVQLPEGCCDVKSVMDRLAILGVQSFGGLQHTLDWIETERGSGRIDKGQAYRLRQKLKGLSRRQTATPESGLELDAKVRQAAASWLSGANAA